MNIELVRPQAELIIDLLLLELSKSKHIYTHECIPTLEELAVKFGMCKTEKFEDWLKVVSHKLAGNIEDSQPSITYDKIPDRESLSDFINKTLQVPPRYSNEVAN